jgi:hypothetical protein
MWKDLKPRERNSLNDHLFVLNRVHLTIMIELFITTCVLLYVCIVVTYLVYGLLQCIAESKIFVY